MNNVRRNSDFEGKKGKGRPAKITDAEIDKIKELYMQGKTHRVIAKETGISQTHVHHLIHTKKFPKRRSNLATALSHEEEEDLVTFLVRLSPTADQLSYQNVRTLLVQFAAEKGLNYKFSNMWKRGFFKRHKDKLTARPSSLLGKLKTVEESASETKVAMAAEKALTLFVKAGISYEEGRTLLAEMNVSGFSEVSSSPMIDNLLVSRGFADLANERSSGPKRKPCTPKTPEQIFALETLFENSPEISRERALEVSAEIGLPAQKILWWFAGRRRRTRASQTRTDTTDQIMEDETE